MKKLPRTKNSSMSSRRMSVPVLIGCATAGLFVVFFSLAHAKVPPGVERVLVLEQPPEPVDHAAILRSLDAETLAEGREVYQGACAACHGSDGTASLPTARSFTTDEMKYGNDPYSMWQTVTYGKGMMAGQDWLTPEERYYVIQYIREELIRPNNPDQYFEVTTEYLANLPTPQEGETINVEAAAAQGLQGAGQAWAQQNPGNYGPALYSQLQGETSAALTVELDHNAYVSYNLHRMNLASAWTGDLNVSETKFAEYRGEGKPYVDGRVLAGLDTWQWAYPGTVDALMERISSRTPLPEIWMEYHGHYQHGEDVILSYSITERNVLEMPAAEVIDGEIILVHTLDVSPSEQASTLYVGRLEAEADAARAGVLSLELDAAGELRPSAPAAGRIALAGTEVGGELDTFVAAAAMGDVEHVTWEVDSQNRLTLHVPASDEDVQLEVLRYAGVGKADLQRFAHYVEQAADEQVQNLDAFTHGGPQRWDQTVVTQGELNVKRVRRDPIYYNAEDEDNPESESLTEAEKLIDLPGDYPYTSDAIGLPYVNPWDSWIRPSALDFLSDGRLVLATYLGDVWTASGIDEDLDRIEWQRIATGLYEPMGIRVINDTIYVTARDRIVRLHDLNGDGEADFYESFHADQDVSDFFHSFAFGLQTDSEGNFYYVKSGQYTDNALPGNVVKVSPDGTTSEVFAIGFRTPNGITISPDDRIFVSDNQGNWIPANKINLVEPGKFYGYVPNVIENGWSPGGIATDTISDFPYYMGPEQVEIPDDFAQPIIWLPQEFDNSPGGGVWSHESWGPYGGRFISSSFGTGWLYNVMLQEVDDVTQAAMTALPFQFNAGIQRVRVSPVDKQLYLVGLTGWDDENATMYGTLNRVRYTGGQGHLLMDANVRPGGIELTFNAPLDDDVAMQPDNYDVLQWNYRWQQIYGSADWSVENPDEKGRDRVDIADIRLSEDGKTVFLAIPDIKPVDTMRIRFDVNSEDGARIKDTVYLTIRKVPERTGDSANMSSGRRP